MKAMTVPQSSLVPPREAPPSMPFMLLTVDSSLWDVLLLTPLQLSHQPNPGVPSRKCPAGWRRWKWQAESDEAGSFYQLHGCVPDHPAQRLPNPRLQGKFGHCGRRPHLSPATYNPCHLSLVLYIPYPDPSIQCLLHQCTSALAQSVSSLAHNVLAALVDLGRIQTVWPSCRRNAYLKREGITTASGTLVTFPGFR